MAFDKLSLSEVTVGTTRIVLYADITAEEKAARLKHMVDLLVLSEQYTWEKLRALYQEVLFMIEQGRRDWHSSIKDLKYDMLRPWDQTPPSARPVASHPQQTASHPQQTSGNQKGDRICFQWNTGRDGCPRSPNCPYMHICLTCKKQSNSEQNHRSKECLNRPHTST